MKQVTITVDGGCSPNPGPGGWGAVFEYEDGKVTELSGGLSSATNNQMELTAVLQAVAALKEPHKVDLRTDSNLVRLYLTKPSSAKNAGLRAIRDLIKEVIIGGKHEVTVKKVPRMETYRADALATMARLEFEVDMKPEAVVL